MSRRRRRTTALALVLLVVPAAACGASSPDGGPATTVRRSDGGEAGQADARASLRADMRARVAGNGSVLAVLADLPASAVLWRDPTGRDRLTVVAPGKGALELVSTQPAGGAGPGTGAVPTTDRTREELAANAALVRQFYRRVLDDGEVAAVAELVDAAYVQHNPAVAPGRTGVEQLAALVGVQPSHGANRTEELLLADGDLVLVLNRLAPSGALLADLFRVRGDRLVEHWDFTEAPAPEPPATPPLATAPPGTAVPAAP